MNKRHKYFIIYPLLTISMMLWAYSYIWAKIALEFYGPLTVIFSRTLLSAIILLPVLLVLKKLVKIKKQHIPHFMLLAFFEPFLYFIGETTGLSKLDASTSSVIISTIPLFTPFAARYFLKEKVTILNIVGIVVSIFGIGVIVLTKGFKLEISGNGLIFLALAVVAAIGYSVKIKLMPGNYSIFTTIFYQNIIGALYFLPIMLSFDLSHNIATGFVPEAGIAILKLGFFASTLAFLFYMYALKFMEITKVNIFTNVIPVFTILFSWLVLNEMITAKKIIGMSMVILGVLISQLNFRLLKSKSSDKYRGT
ncbi:MAG TPA: DMT family transporter [Bacteroidales bacterium]|nr:DMT family transporter [Bacteroidales bacterium]